MDAVCEDSPCRLAKFVCNGHAQVIPLACENCPRGLHSQLVRQCGHQRDQFERNLASTRDLARHPEMAPERSQAHPELSCQTAMGSRWNQECSSKLLSMWWSTRTMQHQAYLMVRVLLQADA